MSQKKQKQNKPTSFHTLVIHMKPDLENTLVVFLLTTFSVLARRLGVIDDPTVKFIPAGPLRSEDWSDQPDTSVAALERQGYMFIDCGGGSHDHHRRWPDKTSNEESSLDLVLKLTGADQALRHLMPVFRLVSDNDLTGRQIVQDRGRDQSATPHTARHLRNVILGWNKIHADDPQAVVDLAGLAYGGLVALAEAEFRSGEADHSRLFLADNICRGVRLYCDQLVEDEEMDPGEAQDISTDFRQSVKSALGVLEDDWHQGEQDYWSPKTTVLRLQRQIPTRRGPVKKPCCLVVGVSDALRYSAVTRRGNRGQNAAHPDRERRPKADITIQFQTNGRWVMSSRHIKLDKVAAAIRRADLERKGVDTSLVDPEALRQVGHLAFPNRAGETVQALLLAYDKAFGNGFRANPFGVECALKPEEIVNLTVEALTDPNR
jgi:hypothetical protein